MIYHYCSCDTFKKIVESKKIWVSDILKMNDADEYSAGFKIIEDLLQSESIGSHFLNTRNTSNIESDFFILSVSFSREGDLLSQWDRYANMSTGISLGFDKDAIIRNDLFYQYLKTMSPVKNGIKFYEVIYEEDVFKNTVIEYINRIKQSDSSIKECMLSHVLTRLALLYKSSFYCEEKEVRGFFEINTSDSSNIEISTRNCEKRGEIRFHQLNTSSGETHSIEEVILGPKCTLNASQVTELLNACGLNEVKIKESRGAGSYR